jgi:hypothetical protein
MQALFKHVVVQEQRAKVAEGVRSVPANHIFERGFVSPHG